MDRPIRMLRVSPRFERSFRRLPTRIQKLADSKTAWFKANAYDARLKTHALSGKLEGYYAFWVNREYRILFQFLSTNEALFIDIGTHALYR